MTFSPRSNEPNPPNLRQTSSDSFSYGGASVELASMLLSRVCYRASAAACVMIIHFDVNGLNQSNHWRVAGLNLFEGMRSKGLM